MRLLGASEERRGHSSWGRATWPNNQSINQTGTHRTAATVGRRCLVRRRLLRNMRHATYTMQRCDMRLATCEIEQEAMCAGCHSFRSWDRRWSLSSRSIRSHPPPFSSPRLVCTHARPRSLVQSHTHTHTQTRTHARTHAHTHTNTRTHTHARAQTHKHTRRHVDNAKGAQAGAYARAHTHARAGIARTHQCKSTFDARTPPPANVRVESACLFVGLLWAL
jgi:hypothetical protein